MSDNELRDRIAEVLDQNFNPDQYPIMASMFRDYAQAVIDDLGLTVEMRVSSVGRTVDRRTGIVTNSTQTRIVGKWEET